MIHSKRKLRNCWKKSRRTKCSNNSCVECHQEWRNYKQRRQKARVKTRTFWNSNERNKEPANSWHWRVTLALAIRRNFGNAATSDVGAMLLEDISRFTVARAEVKAGTCLVASARIFFHWVYSELTGPKIPDSFRLVVHSYRQDATNSGILKRSKLNALILHSAYLRQTDHLDDPSWKRWEKFWFPWLVWLQWWG